MPAKHEAVREQMPDAERVNVAAAEGAAQASDPQGRRDETRPGGLYVVNGRKVDASGKPVEE